MTAATGRSRTGRVVGLAVLAILAVGGVSAIASTPAPVKGAKYSGHIVEPSASASVTFKVSASGKKVTGMRVLPYLPHDGCGQGGPPLDETSEAARIKDGTFAAKLKATGEKKKATVTGEFLSGGKEKGVIKSYPRQGEPPKCGQKTPYKTSAK